jgi:cell division protein FtsZ
MRGSGSAMMGIGQAGGENRAADAAAEAIASRMLESSIDGATRVLLSIAGNKDLGIQEINDAADIVRENVDPEANIIFGTSVDESLGDQVRVTVIATGFDENSSSQQSSIPELNMRPSGSGRPTTRSSNRPQQSSRSTQSARSQQSSMGDFDSSAFEIPEFLRNGRR